LLLLKSDVDNDDVADLKKAMRISVKSGQVEVKSFLQSKSYYCILTKKFLLFYNHYKNEMKPSIVIKGTHLRLKSLKDCWFEITDTQTNKTHKIKANSSDEAKSWVEEIRKVSLLKFLNLY